MTKKEKQEIAEYVLTQITGKLKESVVSIMQEYLDTEVIAIYESPDYVTAEEAAKRLDVKESTAYQIMQKMNDELKERGFITRAGRVPRAFFDEKCYFKPQKMSHPTTNDDATK